MKNVILLVDDNAEIRSAFTDLFRKTELEVVAFSNVTDAQVYLAKFDHRISLKAIVSDLMMGPVDGLDFLSYVKRDADLSKIDFYLFTGAEVSVFQPFLKSFSISGVIQKPLNSKILFNALMAPSAVVSKQAV